MVVAHRGKAAAQAASDERQTSVSNFFIKVFSNLAENQPRRSAAPKQQGQKIEVSYSDLRLCDCGQRHRHKAPIHPRGKMSRGNSFVEN